MDKKARRWFDYAYAYIGGFLPFCTLTGEVSKEDLRRLTKGVLSDPEWDEVERIIKHLYHKLPLEQAFREEKKRIIPDLTNDLRHILPYIDTAFSFGSPRGDIDIGIIANGISTVRVDQSLKENIFLVEKYPIVDWDTLIYFLSDSPKDFVARIEKSRKQSMDINMLTVEQRGYVRSTLKTVNLLWGNTSHLKEIQSYSYF